MGRAVGSGFFSTVGGRDAVSSGPDLSSEQLKAKRNNQERQNRRLGKGEVMGRKGRYIYANKVMFLLQVRIGVDLLWDIKFWL